MPKRFSFHEKSQSKKVSVLTPKKTSYSKYNPTESSKPDKNNLIAHFDFLTAKQRAAGTFFLEKISLFT